MSFAQTPLTGYAHAPPINGVRADCDSQYEKKKKTLFLLMLAILAAQQPALDVTMKNIDFRFDKELPEDQVITLYTALEWSSAEKPKELLNALANSHSVISAWDGQKLIGLANSISDGHLVVYYPHLLVIPEYQGRGIGKTLVSMMKNKYCEFHQQVLVADGKAIDFYKSCGFSKAGSCESLWIYEGNDHD